MLCRKYNEQLLEVIAKYSWGSEGVVKPQLSRSRKESTSRGQSNQKLQICCVLYKLTLIAWAIFLCLTRLNSIWIETNDHYVWLDVIEVIITSE